jgi:hypothetical protein
MADYYQGRYHYGRRRSLTLADRKSGGGTSYKSRASYASGLTYTTDVSAPAREKPLGLQGEEQYDNDNEEDEEGGVAEYVIMDADLPIFSQVGTHKRPLLTAGL